MTTCETQKAIGAAFGTTGMSKFYKERLAEFLASVSSWGM